MTERAFFLSDPVMHLPINDTPDKWYVKITQDGTQIGEFYIGLTAEKPDFYCPLYLHAQRGGTVVLSCDDPGVPEHIFDGILPGGTIEERPELYPDVYHEPYRQQVHFSSRRGWLNDPNGLVFADGCFRMCFQHNPFGPTHGGVNVSWGLAVSRDGVHFTEYPDAIRPADMYTHVASGSAIVDEYDLSGFGKNTIIAAYTALESLMFKGRKSVGTRGQMVVYSTDGGYTFRPIVDGPAIPVASPECPWRDPKILRTDPETLCIAVYETYEGQDCVSFYSSQNCRDWTFRSRTTDLVECPDLFALPCVETGERLWVLYGGIGRYRIGRFENFTFTELDGGCYIDYGKHTYAGQTWNSHPDPTCRYHIAWLHSRYCNSENERPGTAFSQSMTVICRFTLHHTENGYRLFREPIPAFSSLRREKKEITLISLPSERRGIQPEPFRIPLEIPGDAEFTLDTEKELSVSINGTGFTYTPENGHLVFTSGKEYILSGRGALALRVITDIDSVEYFIGGEISASYCQDGTEKDLILAADGLSVTGTVWALESIWNQEDLQI